MSFVMEARTRRQPRIHTRDQRNARSNRPVAINAPEVPALGPLLTQQAFRFIQQTRALLAESRTQPAIVRPIKRNPPS